MGLDPAEDQVRDRDGILVTPITTACARVSSIGALRHTRASCRLRIGISVLDKRTNGAKPKRDIEATDAARSSRSAIRR